MVAWSTDSNPHVPLNPGENRNLEISVTYETWDVMTSNMGGTRTENHSSAPAEGASVSWISESGDASISGHDLADGSGLCQATLTMGSSDAVVRAEVGYATGHSAYATLSVTAVPMPPSTPEWTYLYSESEYSLVNLAAEGSTELGPGEIRTIVGQVQEAVWDVWSDGFTEERRFNYTSCPSSVTLSFLLLEGDGSLAENQVTLVGTDWFSIPFTMGQSRSVVAVWLPDAVEPEASIDFTPSTYWGVPTDPSDWNHLRSEGNFYLGDLQVDGPTYDLEEGAERVIEGNLTWAGWEVWGDQYGNVEHRNESSSSVSGIEVNATVEQGDGQISTALSTTGANGEFTFRFTMGQSESRVVMSAPDGATNALDFTPPPSSTPVPEGSFLREERALAVTLSADDSLALEAGATSPLRAKVLVDTWEVWLDGAGMEELRNHASGPAIGAQVEYSVPLGPGSFAQTSATTDSGGEAAVDFAPGEGISTTRVLARFQGAEAMAELVLGSPQWTLQGTESELLLSLEAGAIPSAEIAATVQLRTWEIWGRNGETEVRHVALAPAVNAEVNFNSVTAVFATNPAATGTDGRVRCAYLSEAAEEVLVVANFAGLSASGTLWAPAAGGTGSGSHPGTGGSGSGGNSGPGDDPGTGNNPAPGGGGSNPEPSATAHPLHLRARVNRAAGGSGIFAETGGTSTAAQEVPQRFRAHFERDSFDADGNSQPPDNDIEEGSMAEYDERMAARAAEQWRLVGDVEFFDYITIPGTEGGGGDGPLIPASATPYEVYGPTQPQGEVDTILELAPASRILPFYEASPELRADPDFYWGGSAAPPGTGDPNELIGTMGFSRESWTPEQRLAYGQQFQGAFEGAVTARAAFVEGILPFVEWAEVWAQTDAPLPAGASRKFLLLAESTDKSGQKQQKLGSVTLSVDGDSEISGGTPLVQGLANFTAWVETTSDGAVRLKPPVARGKVNQMVLLPVEVVELSPKVKDKEGNDIEGSEKPNSGKPLTPFVEVDPHANKIAHREIKVKIGEALKDKKVTWTLEPLPDATPATIRGDWEQSPNHKDRFEASTAYGANGFNKVSQTTGETTIGADGHTAIRVNVPPIGFNQVRIKIQIEGVNTPIDLIDMEVPGVVVIDPGHGGNDSGAVGRTDNTVQEKDLALAYGLKLCDELIEKFEDEKRGLRIVMTRETTEDFVELNARAQVGRDEGADVLVSIHFNSAESTTARGTETFVERTAAEASSGNPGDNKNIEEDEALASALNATTLGAVMASDAGAVERGVKRAGKAVTRDGENYNGNTQDYHPVKACLIEVEFLSNETALDSVKLSGSTGETIKDAFAKDAATDIFDNILNQP